MSLCREERCTLIEQPNVYAGMECLNTHLADVAVTLLVEGQRRCPEGLC